MEIQKYIESLPGTLSNAANVKTIYGEPVQAQGRTVIPVAQVQYGFGGGLGGQALGSQSGDGAEEQGQRRHGGGGGGGMRCIPLGVVEISATETRFLPIRRQDPRRVLGAVLAGFVLGWLLFRR